MQVRMKSGSTVCPLTYSKLELRTPYLSSNSTSKLILKTKELEGNLILIPDQSDVIIAFVDPQ